MKSASFSHGTATREDTIRGTISVRRSRAATTREIAAELEPHLCEETRDSSTLPRFLGSRAQTQILANFWAQLVEPGST
ncbi:hypothetical protein OESDEN_19094 [Oesophagostomum dentatum]|uniref:Uncharacterized protein n=1 Tax=Oesophagostomum dentatum TaxID=61180 RepID=A0A0B1SDE9_OESDE|nr:hypothetical protein OESDEN_19094 [Oesophagostomum dentatum]